MAAEYTYLELRGTVWKRWIESIQAFQPPIDGRSMQHVVAARIAFRVGFNEFSPQVAAEVLEMIGTTVKRQETGEVLLQLVWDNTPP